MIDYTEEQAQTILNYIENEDQLARPLGEGAISKLLNIPQHKVRQIFKDHDIPGGGERQSMYSVNRMEAYFANGDTDEPTSRISKLIHVNHSTIDEYRAELRHAVLWRMLQAWAR